MSRIGLRRTEALVASWLWISSAAVANVPQGVDLYWINPDGGAFHEPANWDAGRPPGEEDRVAFAIERTFDVRFTADALSARLSVASGDVTFELGGHHYGFERSPRDIIVDNGIVPTTDRPSLTLTNGTLDCSLVQVAFPAESSGRIAFGPGLDLGTGDLNIGERGSGLCEFYGGATAQVREIFLGRNGGEGVLVLRDPDTNVNTIPEEIWVGPVGRGELYLMDGATLTTDRGLVGVSRGSTGWAVLSGAGTLWDAGELDIGANGTARLVMTEGATVRTYESLFSNDAHGSTTWIVSDPGTLYDHMGPTLQLGPEGEAFAHFTNGAGVSASGGFRVGPNGSVLVDGEGTTLSSTWFSVRNMTGTPSAVVNGARLVNSNDGSVRTMGTLLIDNATWTAGDLGVGSEYDRPRLFVRNGSTITSRDGEIADGRSFMGFPYFGDASIRASTWVMSRALFLGNGLLHIGDGATVECQDAELCEHEDYASMLEVVGPASSFSVANDMILLDPGPGTVHIGDNGRVQVTGNYVHGAASTLSVELTPEMLDGPTPPLRIETGSATLTGTLAVTLAEGFVPRCGDRFTIVSAPSVIGSFDSFDPPDLPANLWMEVRYGPNCVDVRVSGSCPPDLPRGFAVPFGAHVGGTVDDLRLSDDRYVTIDPRPGATPLLPLARIDIEGAASASDPTRLEVEVEASATSFPGRPPQRLSLFDHAREGWDVVDERLGSLEDTVVDFAVTTGAADFIAPGTNEMRMRLEWFDPGEVFSPLWDVQVDQALWRLNV